jgi:hypothetical protein
MNIEQKPLSFSITATVSKMNEDYLDYTYEDPYAVQPERLRPGRINLPPKEPPKIEVPQNRIVKQQGTFYKQFHVEKYQVLMSLKFFLH